MWSIFNELVELPNLDFLDDPSIDHKLFLLLLY